MKLSVSLSEEDVRFIDSHLRETNAASRSAVIHEALEMLRSADLEDAYLAAWDEWEASEDADLWEQASADGIADAPR